MSEPKLTTNIYHIGGCICDCLFYLIVSANQKGRQFFACCGASFLHLEKFKEIISCINCIDYKNLPDACDALLPRGWFDLDFAL